MTSTMTSTAATLRDDINHHEAALAAQARRVDALTIQAATLDVGSQCEIPYDVARAWVDAAIEDEGLLVTNLAALSTTAKTMINESQRKAPTWLRLAQVLIAPVWAFALLVLVLLAITGSQWPHSLRMVLAAVLLFGGVLYILAGRSIARREKILYP